MLCTKCGKNEATIYFSKTVNGKTSEYNLCADCAKQFDELTSFEKHRSYLENSLFGNFKNPFGSSDTFSLPFFHSSSSLGLLDSFFDNDLFGLPGEKFSGEVNASRCPYCGTTAEDYKNTGKLGCAMCYEIFKDVVKVTKEQKTDPQEISEEKPSSCEEKIKLLRTKLTKAVETEQYEDAARYRDEIKSLESGK